MMRGLFSVCALLALGAISPLQAASVQVETVALKRQTMTDTLSGYGVVSPDTRSLRTVNLPRPGQIMGLMVSAGQVVKKGEPLLEFGTGADAALLYQQARRAVEFAKIDLARTEQLASQQLATQAQLAAAKKALADAEAALRAQEVLGTGRPSERISAPFDAVVVTVQAAQGDRLAAGAPVLQLARAGTRRVLLGVEPEEVARVRPGMAAAVMPVFDESRKVKGVVKQVFGMINPQTQWVDVLVVLPGAGLMPGTRVYAEVRVDSRDTWVVPRSAVLRDARGAYLFQVHGGKARRIEVATGLERDGLIAVEGALDANAPVVSLGNYELQDNMAVRQGAP